MKKTTKVNKIFIEATDSVGKAGLLLYFKKNLLGSVVGFPLYIEDRETALHLIRFINDYSPLSSED